MKSILAAAALTVAIASPALAQTAYRHGPEYGYGRDGAAFARAPTYEPGWAAQLDLRRHSSNPAWDVYDDQGYAGSDPDPFIRSQIARDPRSED